MNPIGAFLERFKNIRPPQEAAQKILAEAVKACLGVVLEHTTISIKNKTAFFTASAVLKSEILLKQKEILSYAKERGVTLSELR